MSKEQAIIEGQVPVVELRDINVIHKTRTGKLFAPDTVHANKNVNFKAFRDDVHDINTVRYVSDRISVMLRGEIIESNTTEEIFNNPQQEYTHTLLAATPSLLDS